MDILNHQSNFMFYRKIEIFNKNHRSPLLLISLSEESPFSLDGIEYVKSVSSLLALTSSPVSKTV